MFGLELNGHMVLYNIINKGQAFCRNLSLGLATKARVCKGTGQEGSPGNTSHAPRSIGECERRNPHTPKWTPTLGIGLPMDSRIFKEKLQGSKPIGLKSSVYHWKVLGTYIFKTCLHDPFGHLKHKLWSKEGLRVKLSIWLLTTKRWESPWFPYV